VVVDHFHAIKLANAVVDQVRRRTQQATLGHHGRKPDPLYRIRKLLLTAAEQLTSLGWVRLRVGPAVGDPTGEVAVAWQGKELLRPVYAASELAHARAALDRFYRWSDGVGVAELSRLARTVRAWEAEILAWHVTGGGSNGPTEAVNLLIKNVKRVGHGFCNFANYRLRLLLHCGVRWQTHRTARLRGRSPRLVAKSRFAFGLGSQDCQRRSPLQQTMTCRPALATDAACGRRPLPCSARSQAAPSWWPAVPRIRLLPRRRVQLGRLPRARRRVRPAPVGPSLASSR
jgi:Transposase